MTDRPGTPQPDRPPHRDRRSTDVVAGSGAPDWFNSIHRHCTRCGGRLELGAVAGEERERLVCVDCGHIAYLNPRLVVTSLPVTENGDVILIRRGFEPGRGLWAQPGGFLEIDETPTEGAVREAFEETGLVVEPGEIVGLYPRLEAAVIVLVYESVVAGGAARISPEALEVRAFAPHAIPWPEIAFRTTYWALVDWLARRRPELRPGAEPSGWTSGGTG